MSGTKVSCEKWMASLSDTLSLTQLTIPGTHDSYCRKGSVKLGLATFAGEFVFTQSRSFDIPAQLHAGVRFLDFRVAVKGVLTHGSAELDSTIYDQLAHVVHFLKEHNTETVLVSVKWEKEHINILKASSEVAGEPEGEAERIIQRLKDIPDAKWWMKSTIPCLGEVRGQMVLLQRFSHDVPEGIRYNPGDVSSSSAAALYNGQDRYDFTEYMDTGAKDHGFGRVLTAKWSDSVLPHLEKAKSSDPGDKTLWINYFSGYAGKPGLPSNYISPFQLAKGVNSNLFQYLHQLLKTEKVPVRLGLLVGDFLDEPLTTLIFAMNFMTEDIELVSYVGMDIHTSTIRADLVLELKLQSHPPPYASYNNISTLHPTLEIPKISSRKDLVLGLIK